MKLFLNDMKLMDARQTGTTGDDWYAFLGMSLDEFHARLVQTSRESLWDDIRTAAEAGRVRFRNPAAGRPTAEEFIEFLGGNELPTFVWSDWAEMSAYHRDEAAGAIERIKSAIADECIDDGVDVRLAELEVVA